MVIDECRGAGGGDGGGARLWASSKGTGCGVLQFMSAREEVSVFLTACVTDGRMNNNNNVNGCASHRRRGARDCLRNDKVRGLMGLIGKRGALD